MATILLSDENVTKMGEVAAYLQGTCKSVDDGLQAVFGEDIDLMDFDVALLHILDDATMCCEECGWWCETSELNDDQICSDCAPTPEDD